MNFNAIFHGKLIELFVWVGLFVLFFFGGLHLDTLASALLSALTIGGMVVVNYFNRYVLIPFLPIHRRPHLYYMVSLIFIYFMVWGSYLLDERIIDRYIDEARLLDHESIYPIFKYSILYILVFAVSAISHTLGKSKEASKRAEQLYNEKRDMELSFLKAQINPHFLFNALNNIYYMTYTQDIHAPDSVLQLSQMLRYVTDDCQADFVPVEKEVAYIENYINFQQLRFGDSKNISFEKEIRVPGMLIPPMILQPFVENCFKYSRIESDPQAFIEIVLRASSEGLAFITRNSLSSASAKVSRKSSGLGIPNVRQRLDLTYGPGGYTLEIARKNEWYQTELHIKTDCR